jgi:hypothetical protein
MPRKNPHRERPIRRSKKWKRRQRKMIAQGRSPVVVADPR